MKANLEIDCTPEEARRFLGLPDVSRANELYVDAVVNAMQGGGSLEQLQAYAQSLAPMGQLGMNLFRQFMESGSDVLSGKKTNKAK